MKDQMKISCIQQGYIPVECKLNGQQVFLLVSKGLNPCCGCNVDCQYKLPYRPVYRAEVISEKIKEQERKNQLEKEKRERVSKRAKSDAHRIIMDVDVGCHDTYIKVYDLIAERGYVKSFRADECIDIVNCICVIAYTYGVSQIHIETNGYGMGVYNSIKEKLGDSIDIVPLKCTRIIL